MNIPKKIRIGSNDYDVESTNEVLMIDHQECKGTINFQFHNIKINTELQDKQGQEQTFLHELVHGIVNERSLELPSDIEEKIVDELAVGLHQVIRDNSEIFKS